MTMFLWVGLGNPGPSYALHRHNIGYMAIDTLADFHGFGSVKKAFQGWTQTGSIDDTQLLLLKPGTFMNESGRAVGEAARFYRIAPEHVTVFHDELDLAAFRVKVKLGGGTAGHHGLRSIESAIGNGFRRVRMGIGHPGNSGSDPGDVRDRARVTGHVLGNFAKSERDRLAELLGATAAEARWLAAGNDTRFMSEVAARIGSAA